MPSNPDSLRIVIAGASSLLGAELRELLGESRLSAADFRLVDEELAAGTLTAVGGEAAVIQPAEEESFEGAGVVFFSGSAEFAAQNYEAARTSGAWIIDLSGGLREKEGARAWPAGRAAERNSAMEPSGRLYWVPSVPGMVAAMLSWGLGGAGLRRLAVTFLRPVAEAGRAGIEELESQTTKLLLFQPVSRSVFDTQVAFNVMSRYGAGSAENLERVRERGRKEAAACIGGKGIVPAVQVLHAPVFYGYTFSVCAELDPGVTAEKISAACREAGFSVAKPGSERPSNLAAAGEAKILLGAPEAEPAQPGTWWIWGAADNVRVPAASAVALAEKLV